MKMCKFQGCRKPHSSKGWCKKHYADVYHGRMDESGNYREDYKPAPKGRKCRFPGCKEVGTRKRSLRQGLCNKHRKWADKGIIDRETCEILEESRIPTMGSYTHCKISGCLKKHKAKGFCVNHYRSYKIYKSIDINGKRTWGTRAKYDYGKRVKCNVNTCTKIMDGTTRERKLVKGFCTYHYQLFTKGYYNEFGMQIKEFDFKNREELIKDFIKSARKRAREKAIKITWEEETKTIQQWSRITKIKAATIKNRHKRGMPVELIFIKGDIRKTTLYKDWLKNNAQQNPI